MNKRIFFCNCGADLISSERLKAISEFLHHSGHPFIQISDLCGCSVNRKDETSEILKATNEALILACYPRAVKLLLGNCGIDHQSLKINYLNFREMNNDQIFSEVQLFLEGETVTGDPFLLQSDTDWPSWYPMIDYTRCSSCGQCADFCLFGVYEKREDKVVVVYPQGCKNNCPACGRICPETAIVFPKYEHKGAIAGDDSIDEIAEQKRQNRDIDAILGSNIYQALEMRKLKRQSIIRSTAMQKAIEERDKALSENNPAQ